MSIQSFIICCFYCFLNFKSFHSYNCNDFVVPSWFPYRFVVRNLAIFHFCNHHAGENQARICIIFWLSWRGVDKTYSEQEPSYLVAHSCGWITSNASLHDFLFVFLKGRVDDNIETIGKRLKVYFETTLPVINYYNSKGKVQKVIVFCQKLTDCIHITFFQCIGLNQLCYSKLLLLSIYGLKA